MQNKNNVTPVYVYILFWSIFLVMAGLNLYPVEVKKIEVYRFDDFQQGQFKGTALDSKGRLFIGPGIKEMPGPGKEYYLSLDVAAGGNIYLGTGHQAAVYRIKPTAPSPAASSTTEDLAGNIEAIFESDSELDVYAVLVSGANTAKETVFVGTSPDGNIYKISPNKGKKEFFDPDEKFIWDLKEDKTGNIICATGNSGGVYQITPEGEGVQIFAAEDTHIISLYISGNNSILAGSGDRGILYRIDNRKVKVLFDSSFQEIRGICEDNDGNIYFSATRELSPVSQISIEHSREKPLFLKKKEKPGEAPQEKSVLYCLNTNGIVEKIWASGTEYIYTVFYDRKSSSVIMGTGDSGRVYSVKKDGSFAIVYESDSAQIFKIVGNGKGAGGGYTLITNNTAAVTGIEDTPNSKGIYYSDVYDLQIQSKLGRLYWDADTGAQTEVSLFIRTGNANVPDSTWGQWSAPFTDSENSLLNIPDCRYFQVKAVLTSKNATGNPYLDRFRIYYMQANLGPQLKKIEVKKPTRKPPDNDNVYNPDVKTRVPPKEVKDNNYLIAVWEARDLNKDKLKYNIYLKKYNAQNWILIKGDMEENTLRLDTRLFQDGKYVLRVVVDDSLANPPSLSKSSDLVSSPFLIDSTAPGVSDFSVTGNRIRFTVEDKTSIIANVFYSFDGKLWYPVFPVDMLNDSRNETFDFTLVNQQGKKYIFLKVLDEFENCKVFQEEFQ